MSAPNTPTTKEIAENIKNQISTQIGQDSPILPKSFIRVLSQALAAVYVILYKYAGFIFQQMFVVTASDQDTTINGRQINPLNEWGRLVGIPSRTAATQAQLRVAVTVTRAAGFLRTGTLLVGRTNGITYSVQGDVELNAATVFAVIQATGDQQGGDGAGTIGNLTAGATLSFANPLPNVERSVVVSNQERTGADAETTTSYRSRILDRFQKRPQGGAYSDYEQWAEEAPGTLRAYPYTGNTAGAVDVYIESSTEADGIPTTAQLAAALASIELDTNGLASRRPVNVFVQTLPITRATFAVQIEGLAVENAATVQIAVTSAVAEYFAELEPFINGLSVLPRRDRVSASALGGVVSAIISANGGQFTALTISRNGSDLVVYDLGRGEKAKSGGVSYI